MHPRVLAFGFGVAALACLLRQRVWPAALFLAVAAALHPTTAVFFAVAAGAGLLMRRQQSRTLMASAAVSIVLVGLWLVAAGPLAGRLIAMDAEWLAVLAGKDYLFPTQWPIEAWLINLLYPVVIWVAWRTRRARGLATPQEVGLVWGATALTLLFLLSVPLTAMEMALAVQLQITRVFWILDFVALAYVAWWLTRQPRIAAAVVILLVLASAGRSYYLLEVWQPERRLATMNLPSTTWIQAMTWLEAQPDDWHVLADPGHAWKYGVSVRVAAQKDTVLESVKDSAIALYDRDIAMRVAERTEDLVDYDRMTTARAHALDAEYDLDVVIVESDHVLALPELFRNAHFVIYDLR